MGSCGSSRKPIFEIVKVMDLFLNNNTITELTSDFFPDGNRELWKKTREVTMNFCGIKTIAEDTFEHLTILQGKVNQTKYILRTYRCPDRPGRSGQSRSPDERVLGIQTELLILDCYFLNDNSPMESFGTFSQ